MCKPQRLGPGSSCLHPWVSSSRFMQLYLYADNSQVRSNYTLDIPSGMYLRHLQIIMFKTIFDLLISCPNSPISGNHYLPNCLAQNLEVIFDFIRCQITFICLNWIYFASFSLYFAIECWPVRTGSVEFLHTVACLGQEGAPSGNHK